MRPVSDAFLRTLAGSHTVVVKATLCETFQTGSEPTGETLWVVAGNVRLDGTAQVRSTLDLTVAGVDELGASTWPARSADLLSPYGNEIYIHRGIAYSDHEVELVGLGYHRIDTPEQESAPDGPIRITGQDRMAGIIDARLTKPRQFTSATTLGAVVDALVLDVYPDAVIVWDDDSDTDALGRKVIVDEDRYAFLDELVRSRGKIWYWDHRGQLVIKDPPDPTLPVWNAHAGTGGTLRAVRRRVSRLGVYNAVVARGEATDDTVAPVRGVAVDINPVSPTRYGGRFGKVPRFFQSPFLLTQDQAQRAAATMLRKGLGLPYRVDFSALPNPALEPWDPVSVKPRGEGARTHVLETLTVPLVAGAQLDANTRDQTAVAIGAGD